MIGSSYHYSMIGRRWDPIRFTEDTRVFSGLSSSKRIAGCPFHPDFKVDRDRVG